MTKVERGKFLLVILGVIGAIAVLFFLAGCLHPGFNRATAPKVGAPPRWVEETPFGGHWDCGNMHYRYNAGTQRCELE